jgi:YL1 nuclear protein C-terminal domain
MKATAPALPPDRQRRSDRNKVERRAKAARKGGILMEEELRTALWIDALEDVQPQQQQQDDADEEYDELEEIDGKSKKRKAKRNTKQGKKTMPKRFLPRSVGTILLEESARPDGVAIQYLDAIAQCSAPLPARKFCPVTGRFANYIEPKSKIPYANMRALEQIRERPPPWMVLSGSAVYEEAVKAIRESSSKQQQDEPQAKTKS